MYSRESVESSDGVMPNQVYSINGINGIVPPPKTATATAKPCQLYTYHVPRVVRTQGHHRHPVYLQNRVYGQIRDPELLWVRGNCHDAIHEYLGWLLGETRQPDPMPGLYVLREAERSMDWYLEASKQV